jgi:hypothetical protein
MQAYTGRYLHIYVDAKIRLDNILLDLSNQQFERVIPLNVLRSKEKEINMDPSSLYVSAKAAYEIAKGISALKTEVERNQAVSKVLEVLLSVQNDALSMQEKQSFLLTEKDNLIKKIAEFEKWSEIESQYELKDIAPGVPVYAYKKTDKATQPFHLLCANCFSKRQKGHYVKSEMTYDGTHYKCLNCDKEIIDYSHQKEDPPMPRYDPF